MQMAIGVYFNFENTTLQQYDEVSRKLNSGQPLTKLSQWPSGGILEHAAWQEESGSLCVFDIWESAEAFQSFGEKLMPIVGEVGLPQTEPHIFELHNFITS
jgi:hypothetical protein